MVLITGAGGGIGRSAAERFLAAGWTVWGSSRSGMLPWTHQRLTPCALELADPSSVAALAATLRDQAGRLDVLVNNAGSASFSPLLEMAAEQRRCEWEILFHGPLDLTAALLPLLQETRGRVVMVTSLAARLPIPFLGNYSAAKAALAAATQVLRMELAESGVEFIDLQPGDLRTGFHDAMPQGAVSAKLRDRADRAYAAIDAAMRSAPPADAAGREIFRLAVGNCPPPRRSCGSWFQAVLAPLGLRLLPHRLMHSLIRRNYRLH